MITTMGAGVADFVLSHGAAPKPAPRVDPNAGHTLGRRRPVIASNTGLPGAIKVDPNAGHTLGRRNHGASSAGHSLGRRAVTSQDMPAAPTPQPAPAAVASPAGGAGGGAVPFPDSPADPPTSMPVGDGIPRAAPGPTPVQIGIGLAVVVGLALVAKKVLK